MQTPKDLPGSILASSSFQKKDHKCLVLITGPSGSGKTTCCVEIVALAIDMGFSVGGILCPAVIEGKNKIGIDQLNVSTGERQRLGIRSNNSNNRTVGCWQMDEAVIAWGNQIIADLEEDIIVIDELGPLELEDGHGYQEALHLLDEERYHIAFIVVRPTLLPIAKLRWSRAQVYSLEGAAI